MRCRTGHAEGAERARVFRVQRLRELAVCRGPDRNEREHCANPVMIKAYREGLPGNGKLFPNGSRIVKIEWLFKKNPESPYFVNVPDTLKTLDVYRERQQAIPRHPWLGLRRFSQ